MKKIVLFIILSSSLIVFSCGPGGSGSSGHQDSDSSLFSREEPDFFEEMEKKDMATKPAGDNKAKTTQTKTAKAKSATTGGQQAEGVSPAEYKGKYHGITTALDVLHMADVQESFLNALVTPMAQQYAFDIFSRSQFSHGDESVEINSEALYDPSFEKHKQVSIVSVDNKAPDYAKDLAFEHVCKKDVKAARHLDTRIILRKDELELKENNGNRAVVSFSFANKELPDGRKFFKHLNGLMYFTEAGLTKVTLHNVSPFKIFLVYHVDQFDLEYIIGRFAEKAYVVEQCAYVFNGAHLGKKFTASDNTSYENYQKR